METPRVLHADRLPPDATPQTTVYVGPPGPRAPPGIPAHSVFADPSSVHRGTARQRRRAYRAYLRDAPYLCTLARRRLRGKNLVCVCAPAPCHADVLLEMANEPDPRPTKRQKCDPVGERAA